MKTNLSKRKLLKIMGISLVTSTAFLKSAFADEKRRSTDKKEIKSSAGSDADMVDSKDDTAKAVAYHSNKKDAQADSNSNTTQDKGLPWEKQFCDNCAIFVAEGPNKGTCPIFAGKKVSAKGICNSWSKKV
jgi:hypothetical protein